MRTLQEQIVIGAIELLQDEKNWCEGSFGLSSTGKFVDPWSDECEKNCAHGALERVAYQLTRDVGRAQELALQIVSDLLKITGEYLQCVNDEWGRKAAIDLLGYYNPAFLRA